MIDYLNLAKKYNRVKYCVCLYSWVARRCSSLNGHGGTSSASAALLALLAPFYYKWCRLLWFGSTFPGGCGKLLFSWKRYSRLEQVRRTLAVSKHVNYSKNRNSHFLDYILNIVWGFKNYIITVYWSDYAFSVMCIEYIAHDMCCY